MSEMESLFLIAKGFSPKAAEEWRKLRRCIPQEYRRDVEMYASLHPISGKYCGLIDQNRLAPYYLGRTIPVDTVRAVSQCIQRNGESRQVFFEESQNGIDKTAAQNDQENIFVYKALGELRAADRLEDLAVTVEEELSSSMILMVVAGRTTEEGSTVLAVYAAEAATFSKSFAAPAKEILRGEEVPAACGSGVVEEARRAALCLMDHLPEFNLLGVAFALTKDGPRVFEMSSQPVLPWDYSRDESLYSYILTLRAKKRRRLSLKVRARAVAKAVFIRYAGRKGFLGFMYKNWLRDLLDDWLHTASTSFKEKRWAHKRGFLSFRIMQYGLTETNLQDFLSDRDYRWLRPINNGFLKWVYDKVAMRYMLSGKAFYFPAYYYHLIRRDGKVGVFPLPDLPDGYRNDAGGVLALLDEKRTLIVKPSEGSHGAGVLKLQFDGSQYWMNKRPVSRALIAKKLLAGKQNMCVTEYVEMHPALKQLYGATSYTIRIMVINKHGDDPVVADAYLRIAADATGVTDNIADGGICAVLDIDTGRINTPEQIINHIVTACPVHPDTGAVIKGTIPNWEKVKHGILDISRYLFQLEYLGFDVIVTEEAFKVIEINTHQDLHRYPHYSSAVHEYFMQKVQDKKQL